MTTEDHLMSRDELRKLAALDVFGLLDPYEADLFNRSFHDAPAAVQDEIVALQAAIASDTTLLPTDEPGPELREKVLARVAEAIEKEAEELAPIPIYRGRRAEAERHRRQIRRAERSAKVWRALSFVLAACFVISLIVALTQLANYNDLARVAMNWNTQDELRDHIGPGFKEFIGNPNAEPIVLIADSTEFKGMATVLLNRRSGSAFLLAMGLPRDGAYQLVIRDADTDEEIQRSDVFASDGTLAQVRLDNIDSGALNGSVRWELIDVTDQTVLLFRA